MYTNHFSTKAFALICTMLLTLSVSAQQYITKSGTAVTPAFRTAPIPPSPHFSKQIPSDSSASHFYIVTTTDLLPTLHPFIRWKSQQGFHIHLLSPATPHPDSIRSALSLFYHSHPHLPMYILLVGDVDRLPAFRGKHFPSGLNNHSTDLYYAEYTGDYLPEAQIGRLSVSDPDQLAQVVDKIIRYEQGYYASLYNQLLLIAGSESRTPAPITTNGQVHYLSHLAALHRPLADTVCFHNPASASLRDSILAALGQRNLMVNYTAHCTAQGWTNPSLKINDLPSLYNPVPTLFINNCCRSNAFAGDCLGEELLRQPQGGAVAVIGATNETLWDEDYYWAVGAKYPPSLTPSFDSLRPGAFDSLIIPTNALQPLPTSGTTLGQMLHQGCRAVTYAGSPFDAFYWEIYSLLGDPSLIPFWTNPDTLTLIAPDSIMAGATAITLRATPQTRITATVDTLLLGTAIALADSMATLHLCRALDTDSLILTATLPEAISATSHPTIYRPSSPFLALADYHATDSLLTLHIKNQGQQTAVGHSLLLTQGNSQGLQLPAPLACPIPTLASLADTHVTLSLAGSTPGFEPLLSAILQLSDSTNQTYSTLRITTPLPDRRPRLTALQILMPDLTPCRQLLPDHDYLLSLTLAHPADSMRYAIQHNAVQTLAPSPATATIPFHTPSQLSHLNIALTPHHGNWHHTYSYWLTALRTTEPFETTDFSNLPWQHPNLHPWVIDSLNPHEGLFCARSAPIGHSLQSVLALDVDILADDTLSFDYNLSSDPKDWLHFLVDGRRRAYWSGNTGWQHYSRPITAGHHRLEWVYQKDNSDSQHDDCARIDNLQLPLALWQQPSGTPRADSLLALPPSPSPLPAAHFTICPNPASTRITLLTPPCPTPRTITLFDNLGRTVDKIKIPPQATSTQYSTAHLRLGTYTLILRHPAGTYIQKMTVIR